MILMFTLPISFLTACSLPWFMDVSLQYCFLQHKALLSPPDTSTAECHFHFDPVLLKSEAISLLFFSSILDTYWPGALLLVLLLLVFLYCSWDSWGKNTEVVCHSLLQWTTFCQMSPPWPTRLGWPHRAWLSFIELDKAVVLVWLDWIVFCEYGFREEIPSVQGQGQRQEELPHVWGQGRWAGGATPRQRPGAAARRTNLTSKEPWLCRRRRA